MFVAFSEPKFALFLLMAFSLIFDVFWGIFCMQKWPYGGMGDFVKMGVSYTRELDFEGSGGPEFV